MRKFLAIISITVVAGLVIYFLIRYMFVLGEGVKAGELNYLVKKGYIFKTYEGKLIQSGLRSRQPGSVQSYEFEFSVVRDDIAQQLMSNSGKEFELHYKEYIGSIPWRGHSEFIVDSILAMRPIRQ
ncbi:MAG: hypothetical protein H7Y03_13990 [Chitinophagaceae bacterium]|nr:hypothetical protein [Chitinophagaceae bacterium]